MTVIKNSNFAEVVELRPKITVVGVGGAGGNAVNNMIKANLQGVEFVVCNTDAQSLGQSLADSRIQLGDRVTQGLGAGSRPEVGRAAAEESMELILKQIAGSNMVFVTAGMGGGTGTGAAPVVAQAAREQGILTVAVVTKPFEFEGKHRMRTALNGIEELEQYVDTLIIIPNQNLFRIANEKTTFADAFRLADDVLHAGVRGVTDLMMMPGLINLDFADIRTVMMEMGKAMMGTGEASGEGRALAAAAEALSNPLLDDVSMKGARGVLINITGGLDMTLFEVDEAANRVREEVDPDANIILGSTLDQTMQGSVRVSVVATGIVDEGSQQKLKMNEKSLPTSGIKLPSLSESETVSPRGFFTRKREEETKEVELEENDIFSKNYQPHRAEAESRATQAEKSFPSSLALEEIDPISNMPLNQNQESHPLSTPSSSHKPTKLSLFERLTGSMRSMGRFPTEENDPAPSQKEEFSTKNENIYTTSKDRQQTNEQDELNVPAFLRRRAQNK